MSSELLEGHVLYLCYFGLREPLVQTQVLPYLRQLCGAGMRVSILTFETSTKSEWTVSERDAQRQKLEQEGISWYSLKYHKRPTVPATFFDILNGSYFTWKFIRRFSPDIVHGRVHVPTLMGAIARKFASKRPMLLFDIRGFFPEEYTDAGRWKENGLLYRTAKWIEKWLLKEADGYVVLTEKARDILFPESRESGRDKDGKPVEVIPCCVDLKRFSVDTSDFREDFRRKYGIGDRLVVAYVGSFGGWYLTDETFDFLVTARESLSNIFTLILTQTPKEQITCLLKDRGFKREDYWIGKVPPERIPDYLSVADVGLSFIKPCYSKQSSSPTKNAEYFASGLPIIANSGVGDTAAMTIDDDVGVIIDQFNESAYKDGVSKILEMLTVDKNFSERCRRSAAKRFDLESVGGLKYRRIYHRLLSSS